MHIDRRRFLGGSSLLLAGSALSARVTASVAPSRTLPSFYDEIGRRTFRFFWER
jgi:hypothetical protein